MKNSVAYIFYIICALSAINLLIAFAHAQIKPFFWSSPDVSASNSTIANQHDLSSVGAVLIDDSSASTQTTRIDCAQSKIWIPAPTSCFNTVERVNNGFCLFDDVAVYSSIGETRSFARASIVNRINGDFFCSVTVTDNPRDSSQYPIRIKTQNSLLEKYATNWSEMKKIGDLNGMYFDFPQRKCFAFYKPGPAWRVGYLYVVRAYICGDKNKGSISENEIIHFALLIKVKEE